MRRFSIPVLAAIVTIVTFSCATVHGTRPLARHEQQLSVSVGGPLFTTLGFPMPIPLVGASYLYGLSDRVTVGATVYATDALFGTGHAEANGVWGIIGQNGALPELALAANLHAVTDFKSVPQLFPELSLTPSWQFGPAQLYTGASGMFNLYPDKADGLAREYLVIPAFYVGLLWGARSWRAAAELKYFNPWASNVPLPAGYVGIGQWGALAPYVSFSYLFGGAR